MSLFGQMKLGGTSVALAGCTQIPEDHQRFVARQSDATANTDTFQQALFKRGFQRGSADWYQNVEQGAFIGLQRLEAPSPADESICWEKEYWDGSRTICFATAEDQIEWVDAGWFGASL